MSEKCCIRSYSGPHFPAFGLNNSEYDTFYEVGDKWKIFSIIFLFLLLNHEGLSDIAISPDF